MYNNNLPFYQYLSLRMTQRDDINCFDRNHEDSIEAVVLNPNPWSALWFSGLFHRAKLKLTPLEISVCTFIGYPKQLGFTKRVMSH